MLDWNKIITNKELLYSIFGNEHYATEPPRYLWKRMQFTGLYDCEGKEIWESDLVKILNERSITKKEYWYPVYQIVNEGWSFKMKWISGGKSIDTPEFYIKHWPEQIKIIGNLYEHPNLVNNES